MYACGQFNVTYKFGGAAVADAERMVEVAQLICRFPENAPVVVMSAMGKVHASHNMGT
jgi:aspartokinase